MDINVVSRSGEAKSVSVSDAVFSSEYKEALIHQLVVAYLANGRSGSKAQKSRSAVSGGGAKPWRQKGTGRARAGTSRSPIWRSGGVTFAASPDRNYTQKINRKAYRIGMKSILSQLLREDRLVVVDELTLPAPKTKHAKALLGQFVEANKILVVASASDEDAWMNLALASRNLKGVSLCAAEEVNPVSLLNNDKVLITEQALNEVEQRLS